MSVKGLVKGIFHSKRDSVSEKSTQGVRPDVFDENAFLQQYPVTQSNTLETQHADGKTMQSTRRPSVDVPGAAQNGRSDPYRTSNPGPLSNGRVSTEATRTSVDLVEAANNARKSRGEHPLPVEPERMAIKDPENVKHTSSGSPSKYSPTGGKVARASAAAETTARRQSLKATSAPAEKPTFLTYEPDGPMTFDETNLIPQRTHVMEMRTAPPSSSEQTIPRKSIERKERSSPVSPVSPTVQYAVSEKPKLTHISPKSTTTGNETFAEVRHPLPLKTHKHTPPVPAKSNRRSMDGYDSSRVQSPEPVVQIMNPDGTLHERYTTNTEDVETLEKKFSKAVIHETVKASVHNVITTAISRDIHTHEIRQHVLPVIEKVYLPERHWMQTADGRFVEISPNEVEQMRGKYAYATQVQESVSAVTINGVPFKGSSFYHAQ